MIEFGDLQADLPTYQNSGALVVDNVLPLAKGYKSLAGFQALSGTGLTGSALGLFTSFSASGSTNYAGDATKLYQMNSSLVFQDKSKAGGYNNSTTENARDFWAFTQFGSNIIATNFADNIQKFEEGVDSAFSDLVSLKAKYIAVIRDFVVSGYTTESSTTYNQRVKWSGINDSSTWTPSQATQSGFQDIVGSHGNIQAIVGGESAGVIFMEKAIYRMSYVGVPLIFQFDKIADNIGAFAPKSVASYGNQIFFLAQDGFYKLTGAQQLEPIGNGKVDNFFFDDLSSNLDGITSAVDPNNSIVVWSYRGSGATGTTNNKLLIYNYAVNKWSTGSGQDLEFIASASQEAFNTLESLDVLGDLDNLPRSLDSYFYREGVVGLAGFNSDNKFGKFIANSLSATVDTTEFEGAEGKRSTLINCRPIVDGTTNTSVTITPITRQSQLDTTTTGSAVSTNDTGTCPLRSTSRYHRIRVNVTGNFNTMSGVDIEARPEGGR
ncbi:phage stabilisation protein [uncultured Mediterranean phage uvMED]|nr:phage stabilisation protein [uncultured Mediterranean phage uvMED]